MIRIRKCKICGEEHDEMDLIDGICSDCASAMLQKDRIDLEMGFEDS